MYTSGDFTTVNGATTRNRLAALDTTTGIATTFNPDFGHSVFDISLDNNTMYVGGEFFSANDGAINLAGLAVFNGLAEAEPEVEVSRSSSGSKPRNRVVAVTPTVSTPTTPAPAVCPAYISSYIKRGEANNVADVKKLQAFLNETLQTSLVVDGIYGTLTFNAVVKFQEMHFAEILAPWNSTKGTGWVYVTTTKKINSEYCRLHP